MFIIAYENVIYITILSLLNLLKQNLKKFKKKKIKYTLL